MLDSVKKARVVDGISASGLRHGSTFLRVIFYTTFVQARNFTHAAEKWHRRVDVGLPKRSDYKHI